MARPYAYHGEGTIIEISEDGQTFTKLPPLERFEKMRDITTCDLGIPTAVEVGDIVAVGPGGPSNPGIAAIHAYHQSMKSVFCRVTFRDGDSKVIMCSISYLKLEPNRFILHLKNQS